MDDAGPSWLSTPSTPLLTTRQPPVNIGAELAFLGALLHNNKVLDQAHFLRPEHFGDPVNGRIFTEARRLIGEGRVVDAITLKTVFEQSGVLQDVGGVGYLTSLLSAMVGIINAKDYARVIREASLRRELIDIGETLVNEAFGSDPSSNPEQIALNAVALIDQATMGNQTGHSVTLDAAIDAAVDAMELAMTSGKPPGISTGFRSIDLRLGGFEAGNVYVIGGRAGMGKSALGNSFALNVARQKIGVLSLSLEMTAAQLGRRTLSIASRVPIFVIRNGTGSQGDVNHIVAARKELRGLPLTIDDATGQTPRMIAAKVRAAKRKHGLGLVLVDHLNITGVEPEDAKHGATYAIGKASNTMKRIAKDCDVAVLLLVQLNRGVESRDDKRPGLADLRQSGDIEQDADAVGFVYREEYYLGNAPEQKDGETSTKFGERTSTWEERKTIAAGKADLIWAKVRDGEPGTDHLYFEGRTTSFSEQGCD